MPMLVYIAKHIAKQFWFNNTQGCSSKAHALLQYRNLSQSFSLDHSYFLIFKPTELLQCQNNHTAYQTEQVTHTQYFSLQCCHSCYIFSFGSSCSIRCIILMGCHKIWVCALVVFIFACMWTLVVFFHCVKVSVLVCMYILWVIASLCVFMYVQPLFHGHVMVSAPCLSYFSSSFWSA